MVDIFLENIPKRNMIWIIQSTDIFHLLLLRENSRSLFFFLS
jgi:hypothetical protein